MKEIDIFDIENIKIGNAEDIEGGTGCTVIICEKGAPVGIDIRGGGPASRETQLLSPLAAAEVVHAVVLSGGSAFGLDAAGGVMQYLEEKGIGFETGIAKVPLVCQSCIFDLIAGKADIRPDKKMGYTACENAQNRKLILGNSGAGMGATVGKYFGVDYMMKSGLGAYAVQIGDVKVGALVCVNALGDIFDVQTGKQIAGLLTKDRTSLRSTEAEMYKSQGKPRDAFNTNTTIGIVITNARFDKTKMNKIAAMAQNGYARVIRPVNTTADGDSVYAMSAGEVEADINAVGTLAAYVMANAVNNAVKSAKALYGLKCFGDIK